MQVYDDMGQVIFRLVSEMRMEATYTAYKVGRESDCSMITPADLGSYTLMYPEHGI